MMKDPALSMFSLFLLLGCSRLATECHGDSSNNPTSVVNHPIFARSSQGVEISLQNLSLDHVSHDAGAQSSVDRRFTSLGEMKEDYITKKVTSLKSVFPDANDQVVLGKKPLPDDAPSLLPRDEEQFGRVRFLGNSTIRDDFPCPQAASIAPCQCWVDDVRINLNCTLVESEEQLATVFQQEFPVPTLYAFYMDQNNEVRALRNILNGVTFDQIVLSPGPFVLEEISDYFLFDLRYTLNYLYIENSQLNSDFFPFGVIPYFEDITRIDIHKSAITWLPKLSSTKLGSLRIDYSDITSIETGTLDGLSNLHHLQLVGNAIHELKAGTLPIREQHTVIYLEANRMKSIEPGSFFHVNENSTNSNEGMLIRLDYNQLHSLEAGTFPLRNGEMNIHLQENNIANIEPGTFMMPTITDSLSVNLYIYNNNLTSFDEAVFGEMMPYITDLLLKGNPLECYCDVAWLVLNPAYMAKVDSGTTCANGTPFADLDPEYYENFC